MSNVDTRGIDYDLESCLIYNPQPGYDVGDIQEVVAVWQGENEGDDWRWVFQLNDDRWVFLRGGCDYTGWDCQSSAASEFTDNAEAAAHFAVSDIEVYTSLMSQIEIGKEKTWREQKDEELGANNFVYVTDPGLLGADILALPDEAFFIEPTL